MLRFPLPPELQQPQASNLMNWLTKEVILRLSSMWTDPWKFQLSWLRKVLSGAILWNRWLKKPYVQIGLNLPSLHKINPPVLAWSTLSITMLFRMRLIWFQWAKRILLPNQKFLQVWVLFHKDQSLTRQKYLATKWCCKKMDVRSIPLMSLPLPRTSRWWWIDFKG